VIQDHSDHGASKESGHGFVGSFDALWNPPSREQRLLKNDFTSYLRISALKSFTLFITVKTITKLNLGHSDKFEIKV